MLLRRACTPNFRLLLVRRELARLSIAGRLLVQQPDASDELVAVVPARLKRLDEARQLPSKALPLRCGDV